MKKTAKFLVTTFLIAMMLLVSMLPASAQGFDSEKDVNEFISSIHNDIEPGDSYYSNKQIEYVAKSMDNENDMYDDGVDLLDEMYEENNEARKNIKRAFDFINVYIIILVIIVVVVTAIEIICIYITAPKYGMTRLWAIVPIFSRIFGFIIYLVILTIRKNNTTNTTNTIMCPVCNGKHPYGTKTCSICGTRLGE